MRCSFIFLLLAALPARAQTDLLRVGRSDVTFLSEAPLERITATCTNAGGVLSLRERTFAIQVPLREMVGFNNPLQREHFNENYMESTLYPNAVFQGRIIEACDLTRSGVTYHVRAKGVLTLHGIDRERIIPCTVDVDPTGIRVRALFDIVLADHQVRIPRVVQQKISEVIKVKVDLFFPARS